jgi:GTPase SAR1 family protein
LIPPHIQELLETEGAIILVGSGRSGKTALGHYLCSQSSKPKYALNYPQSIIDSLPEDWHTIDTENVFKLKDCIIFLDDTALFMSSRNFNTSFSKRWVKFQTIISHKSITLVFVIQSTNLLDIGTLRSQRMAVLYKYSDATNILYEREEFKQIALLSNQIIHKNRISQPEQHPKSWVFDVTLSQTWTHPLPQYWSNTLSTPYRDYFIEADPK